MALIISPDASLATVITAGTVLGSTDLSEYTQSSIAPTTTSVSGNTITITGASFAALTYITGTSYTTPQVGQPVIIALTVSPFTQYTLGRVVSYTTTTVTVASNPNAVSLTNQANTAIYFYPIGTGNVALGSKNLNSYIDVNSAGGQISGGSNTAIGVDVLRAITTGGSNTAVGAGAMRSSTTSNYTVAIGYGSGYSLTNGNNNTLVGVQAGANGTSASNNILIGKGAGASLTTGSSNTIIGGISGTSALTSTIILAADTTERLRITTNGGWSIGATGTAYGTSGQVLTSVGDATPVWSSTITLSAIAATPATVLAITGAASSTSGATASAITITGGAGGDIGAAGIGGAINITGGRSGINSTNAAGGGAVNIQGGAANSNYVSSVPGSVNITGGSPQVAGQSGANVVISGSAGYASATTATGGNVTITGGSGGSTGAGTGGDITISSGAGTGVSGTAGKIYLNINNTTSVPGSLQIQNGGTTQVFVDANGNTSFGTSSFSTPSAGFVGTANTFGFKNRIINGSFMVQQYLTTTGTGTGSASSYVTDCWIGMSNGATANATTSTASVSLPTSGVPQTAFTLTQSPSAGGGLSLAQRIEQIHVQDLFGKTCTVQLYAATSNSSTITWNIYAPASTKDTWAAVGGGVNITTGLTSLASGTFTTTASLALNTFSFSMPNTCATLGMMIVFSTASSPASASMTITGVQLEKAPSNGMASGYDYRPYNIELLLAQRYYQIIGVWALPTLTYASTVTRSTMRTSPTIALGGTATGTGGVWSVVNYSTSPTNGTIYQSTVHSANSASWISLNANL